MTFISYNFFSIEKESPFRIGILMIGEERFPKYTGLREGLADLGYLDDEFTFIIKESQDDTKILKKHIHELLKYDLDLIVSFGGIETAELKKELELNNISIPVVFAGVAAPKEIGLIEDYRLPGGNFTGINNYHTSLSGKRLELLQKLVPSLERVLVIFDQDIEVSRVSLEKTIEAANALSIKIVPFDVSNPQYKEVLDKTVKKNDALLILPSFRIETLTEEIVHLSEKNKIPVMGLHDHEVESGYLASYGTSFYDQGYHTARFVSSVLQGNSPSEIPTELPDTVRFLVNKEVAEQLNIQVNTELTYIAEFINEVKKGEEK